MHDRDCKLASGKEEKLKKLTRHEVKLWQRRRRQWVSVVARPQPHRRRPDRRRRAPKARAPSSWGSRHSIRMCSRCAVPSAVDCPRVAVAAADSAIAELSRQRLWPRRRISGWRRPTAETATEAMVAAADTWPPAPRARSRKWFLCRGCTWPSFGRRCRSDRRLSRWRESPGHPSRPSPRSAAARRPNRYPECAAAAVAADDDGGGDGGSDHDGDGDTWDGECAQPMVRVDRAHSLAAWSSARPAARSRFDLGCSERRTPARLAPPAPVILGS